MSGVILELFFAVFLGCGTSVEWGFSAGIIIFFGLLMPPVA